jgi:hypothetical protein
LTSEPLRHGTNKQKLTKHRPKAPLILSPGAGPQATEPPFGLGPMTPSYARGAIERHLTSRPPEFPGNSMGSQCAPVGRMSRRAAWATDQIAKLAEDARSESVRLAALRSMLSDMMAVADFAGLEGRIAKLEEQDRVRHEENAPAAN